MKQKFRLLSLIVFLALIGTGVSRDSLALAAGDESISSWRIALATEFAYYKVVPALPIVTVQPDGDGAFTLPLLIVNGDILPRGLEDAVKAQRISDVKAPLSWSGGDLINRDFARGKIRVAVPSLLFVPIGVKIGW